MSGDDLFGHHDRPTTDQSVSINPTWLGPYALGSHGNSGIAESSSDPIRPESCLDCHGGVYPSGKPCGAYIRKMFHLRPRTVADCDVAISWIPDAEAMHLFTGTRLRWPLTVAQLTAMQAKPGFSAWTLAADQSQSPAAHFDLTIDGDVAHLGRVLTDPQLRGNGLAHVVVGFAKRQAKSLGASEMRLNVITGNEPAIRTYLRAGFTMYSSERPNVTSMNLVL